MKTFTFSIILYFLLSICSFSQQIELKGNVTVHNSKYRTGTIQYVENAQISAAFTSPTATDNQGNFELSFVGMDGGTRVDISVEKNDLEVVNSHDLANVIIGRKLPLRVAMDTNGNLAKSQTEFYNISKKALYAEYERKVAILEQEGKEQQQLIADLNADLNLEIRGKNEAIHELKKQLEEAEKRLPDFARELAYVNLDFASTLYIEAYELFKEGKIREALAVLDDAKLEKVVQDALTAIEIGKQLTEKGMGQVEQVIKSYQLKAEGYNLLFEYRNAAEVYEKVIALMEKVKMEEDMELANAYRDIGSIYQDLGLYDKSLEYNLKNMSICEKLLTENDLDLAISYNNLALIYQDLGKYEKALQTQQKTITIEEKILDDNHSVLATSYNNLACIYYNLGNYEKALQAQQEAIQIRKKVLDDNHPHIAQSYHNLALIYQGLGKYEKALQAQQKATQIWKKVLDDNHPHIAQSYNNLALIYRDLGDYERALQAQQKAIVIEENVLDINHPHMARSYNNLASIYRALGAYKKALKTQQKAITIGEKVWDTNHPHIALFYNRLALIYQALGDYEKALQMQKKSITIGEKVLETNHPYIALFYNSLALIHLDLKNYNKALQAQQKAIQIREKVLDENHPKLATSYHNLASIFQALGDYEKALQIQQKAIVIREKILDANHPVIATSYSNLANIYTDLKDYEKALQAQQKAITIQEKVLDANHPSLAISYHNITSIFYYQNDLDQALYYEKKAYNIMKEKLLPSHPKLKVMKRDFVFLYEKRGNQLQRQGNYQKAIQDFQKALTFQPNHTEAMNSIGLCYYYIKDYKRAISYYDQSYQLDSTRLLIYLNNTGIAYAKLKQLQEAKTRFERLQKLIPNDGLVYRDWTLYYTLKGDFPTALDNLEKAVQLGYNDLNWLTTDESLELLRKEDRFQKIIQQLQSQTKQ